MQNVIARKFILNLSPPLVPELRRGLQGRVSVTMYQDGNPKKEIIKTKENKNMKVNPTKPAEIVDQMGVVLPERVIRRARREAAMIPKTLIGALAERLVSSPDADKLVKGK